MARTPTPIRLDVLRAQQRPADVVFTVQLWRLDEGRWWHDPYTVTSRIGKLPPSDLRLLGHAIYSDGRTLWCEAGSPIQPKRKRVKARRRRR
jgi:hypothetical protein